VEWGGHCVFGLLPPPPPSNSLRRSKYDDDSDESVRHGEHFSERERV